MVKSNIAKRITLFIVFSVITSSVFAQQASGTGGEYKLLTDTLHSNVLNESRTVTVQLPKSYESTPNKKYPVIYRLDGKGNIPLITAVLERLQEANAAPEVIIVAIENTDRQRDLFPTINQEPQGPVGIGGGAPKFLSFIENELIPFMDNKYRTHNFKILAGASAGGVFSLYALQTNPELFQAHLAYSAAVWWNYGATANSTKAFMAKTKTLDNYLYMNIGEESGFMRERYDDLQNFISSNTPKGLTFVSDKFDAVSHGLTSAAGIFNAYHNLFLPLRMPPQAYTGEIRSISDYYNRLSKQYGEQTPPPEWVVRELGYHFVNNGDLEEAIKLFKYGITLYPEKPDATTVWLMATSKVRSTKSHSHKSTERSLYRGKSMTVTKFTLPVKSGYLSYWRSKRQFRISLRIPVQDVRCYIKAKTLTRTPGWIALCSQIAATRRLATVPHFGAYQAAILPACPVAATRRIA